VLDCSTLKSGRPGYQWTRKVAQKTIIVSLRPEQFQSLQQGHPERAQTLEDH
jgi:hypothetical protein